MYNLNVSLQISLMTEHFEAHQYGTVSRQPPLFELTLLNSHLFVSSPPCPAAFTCLPDLLLTPPLPLPKVTVRVGLILKVKVKSESDSVCERYKIHHLCLPS